VENTPSKMPPAVRSLVDGPTMIIKVGPHFRLEWYFENSGWQGRVSLGEYTSAVAELNRGLTKLLPGMNAALPWLLPEK
jgi:hypothetical protein